MKDEETGEIQTGEGYVMVRERSIISPTENPPLSSVTTEERSEIDQSMDRIYDNGEMEIYLNEADDE